MNKDVDDIFDRVSEAVAKGENTDQIKNEDSSPIEQKRLQLSAIQKQLEAVITMEAGLREKLVPVLSSMQFEDGLRQRVEHLTNGWTKIIRNILIQQDSILFNIFEEIKDSLSSVEETKSFYHQVLKSEPP